MIVPTYVPEFLKAGTGTVKSGVQETTWLPRIAIACSTIKDEFIEVRVCDCTVAVPPTIECTPEA